MKKRNILAMSILLLLSLILSACTLDFLGSQDREESLAQTMVAMGLTQTAMAEEIEITPEITEEIVTEAEEIAATEEIAAPVEITHTITPGSPGWINKWFFDTDSSKGSVSGGDDFVANLFERPFTENEMVYRSDVDIIKTEISEDSTFYYVTLYLDGTHPDGGLQAAYGVEIDINRDGRGELLVIANRPSSAEWDIAGVSVHKDLNHDVGGSRILRPDTGYAGDSYEQVAFSMEVLDDPDMAWSRAVTSTPPSVTIAFKKSLVNSTTFVWGVWAADSLLDPALLDLHDTFTQDEAGSPYTSNSGYPLKAVNLVDNTCRETYQFEATQPIPGLCYIPQQPTTPPPTAQPTDEPPEETEPPLGDIHGVAFDDLNNKNGREDGEPLTGYSVTISLREGSCGGAVIASTSSKSFSFGGLPAGSYCVTIAPSGSMTTPSSHTVSLPAGGSIYVEFGYYVIQ